MIYERKENKILNVTCSGARSDSRRDRSRQESLRAGSREQCWLPTEAEAGAWQV